MNKELKNKIIMLFLSAAVSAAVSAAAFMGNIYFDEKNNQNKYIGELHKQLYDREAVELEKIKSSYASLRSQFDNGYGLTTYELQPNYVNLRDSVESYQKYLRELERFGNSSQVQVAKNLNEWVIRLYAELDLQYKTAEGVERRVRELLITKNPSGDIFKSIDKALESDLDHLIQSENRVYYETGWYQMPIINGIEQNLNYQFRNAIGLDATQDIARAIQELPSLAKRKPESEYKESKYPFLFAQGRAYQAATLEFKGDENFYKYKNEVLKQQSKMKFIALVLENDKELKASLKNGKDSALKRN